eukprot:3744311-Rhodomonas_salina.2
MVRPSFSCASFAFRAVVGGFVAKTSNAWCRGCGPELRQSPSKRKKEARGDGAQTVTGKGMQRKLPFWKGKGALWTHSTSYTGHHSVSATPIRVRCRRAIVVLKFNSASTTLHKQTYDLPNRMCRRTNDTGGATCMPVRPRMVTRRR